MKKIISLFILFFACVACSNNQVSSKESEIFIEKLSVQEIDKGNILKDLDIEKNTSLTQKLNILNDNFKTIPKLNPCENMGSINTGEFAIENDINLQNNSRNKNNFKIYQHENRMCVLKKEVKNAQVVSAIYFNNKLYLEVDNFSTSKKNNLVLYENGRLSVLKADVGHINNFVISNNKLYMSVNQEIYIIENDGKIEPIKNPYKDREFFSIFTNNKNLVILYKMNKGYELEGIEYSFKEQSDEFNNLDNYDIVKKITIKSKDNQFITYLEPNITQESDKYIIIDQKLVCNTNLNFCYRISIAGERIIALYDDKLLLSSDIVYLADLNKKIKTEIAKDNIEGFTIINNNIYFRINKNDKITYIKYELVN